MAGNLAAHWWVILLVVLLVFGATRLPQLARGVGQSINILKKEVKGKDDTQADDTEAGASDPRSTDQH